MICWEGVLLPSVVVDAGEMFCRGAVGGGFVEGAGAPLTIWSRRFSDMLVKGWSRYSRGKRVPHWRKCWIWVRFQSSVRM